jgi:hypothetical protein
VLVRSLRACSDRRGFGPSGAALVPASASRATGVVPGCSASTTSRITERRRTVKIWS